MYTLTDPCSQTAHRCDVEPLLRLHRSLFPERYASVPLYSWTADTAVAVAALVGELRAETQDRAVAAVLSTIAEILGDADDLGVADALDRIGDEVEAACERLLVRGFAAP